MAIEKFDVILKVGNKMMKNVVKEREFKSLVLYQYGSTVFNMGRRLDKIKVTSFSDFTIASRVNTQLYDLRLGNLLGKLNNQKLNILAHNPQAQFLYDTKSGHVNIIQKMDNTLLRITVSGDAFKIISVGPLREKNLINSIKNGRFIPVKQEFRSEYTTGLKP